MIEFGITMGVEQNVFDLREVMADGNSDIRNDAAGTPEIVVENLNFYYGDNHIIKNASLEIQKRQVTAFIGPSGCGKSTLLRCFNRMNDLVPVARMEGRILIGGTDIYDRNVDISLLRRKVGMVFQKSNPFPGSIFENVAFGLRIRGLKNRTELSGRIEEALKGVGLWDEVSDRLNSSALGLSGGQQQRLCMARALATEPEVILMDEPCSALDPIATTRIEELILDLSNRLTILIVTHNMQQAARISGWTAFLLNGEVVEFDRTDKIFQRPKDKKTDDYIRGKFG